MNRYRLAQAILGRLDPETAHGLTLWLLRAGLGPTACVPDDPILAIRVWGLDFPNPIGLAAGFDKNAVVIDPMHRLGFGFVEVGTITPAPQPGNPKPRVFRLADDEAVINRLGFPSEGMAAAAERLGRWRAQGRHEGGRPQGRRRLIGVNLGKNRETEDAAADYAAGARALGAYADYLVINVSSPNTPGLRALQGRAELGRLVGRVRAALAEAEAPPLLVKIAPDLTETDREDIAAVALQRDVAGLIVSNTTIERPEGLAGRHRSEAGGLSGRPLLASSTAVLGAMYRLTEGRVPLVGVGGVGSAADAYAKIRAGASLVQLYTGLVYQGPGLVTRIKSGLAELLRRDGFGALADAVGADHR